MPQLDLEQDLLQRQYEPTTVGSSIFYPRAYYCIARQPDQAAIFSRLNKLPAEANNTFAHLVDKIAALAKQKHRTVILELNYDTIVLTIKNGKLITGQLTFLMPAGIWLNTPDSAPLLAYLLEKG